MILHAMSVFQDEHAQNVVTAIFGWMLMLGTPLADCWV